MVLVDEFAKSEDIKMGQEISVLTEFGLTNLNVVGLIAKEGAGLTNQGKFGVMKLSIAQKLSHRNGEVDQIDIVTDFEKDNPKLLSAFRTKLSEEIGTSYSVLYPSNQGDRMNQMLSGYQIGLNFMAGIALFVGAFLIFNAFSMTVVERTRELGLLRSIGMTRRQIMNQVILEGVILGLIGAIFGAGFGILISQGLMLLMSQILGQSMDATKIPISTLTFSISIGVAVTMLAAVIPAFQASRISPLEALRLRSNNSRGLIVKFGWVAGIFFLLVSAFILVLNPFPYDVQFRLGSLTVFTLFFGAMLIIPQTLKFWQYICRWPLRLIFGNLGDIGSRNLERAKRRTMITCAALMVGVSMIVVTQGMIGSFTADLYKWMDAYIGGDIYIGAPVPLSFDLKNNIKTLHGVEQVAPIRYFDVSWINGNEEIKISFMAVEPKSYTSVTSFVFSEPKVNTKNAIEELSLGNTLFISSVISEKYNVKTGDEFIIRTRDKEEKFKVGAIVTDFFNQGLVVTGNWADMKKFFNTM